MDGRITSNLIDANIKLQDENKMLKIDNQMLENRIKKAIDYINKEFVFGDGTLGEADVKLVGILKGEIIYN